MKRSQIGVVKVLFRYPVKSMLGEQLPEVDIGSMGVIGDRAYALREANGRVVTAKKWAQMFEFSARYDAPPSSTELTPPSITLPDGRRIQAQAPDASAVLSAVLGRQVVLERAQGDQRNQAEIDPGTVFGDVPPEQAAPNFATPLPDSFPLPPGTFFDSASIHVLASGTLVHLRKLIGDDAQIDPRRFRPNIFIETEPGQEGFLEDSWLEGTLAVGDQARIAQLRPALRCVMTTHRQADLNRDMRILRTTAQHHQNNVGVFGAIDAPGKVRIGDPVFLVTP
ncbi:MAG: MOSC domain-containing protein [Candidatus Binatia bacterium]